MTYEYRMLSGGKAPVLDPSDVTITTRAGLTQKCVYSEKRGVVTIRQGESERKSYYYRAPGQKYDGRLRRVEENGKLTQEFRYDRKTGVLTEVIDARGVSTFFEYDSRHRASRRNSSESKPVRIRRGNRRESELFAEYVYNDEGRLAAAKDGNGRMTGYAYTKRGEIAAVTHPGGDVTKYAYDPFGRCVAVSASGRTEHVEYNEHGRLKQRIAADGTKTAMIYNPEGDLVRIERNGRMVKEVIHDEFHRVVGEIDALKRVTRQERDFRGNLLALIAPNGSVTRYEYDESDRRVAQIDGNGNRIQFEYDASGKLVKQTNALGNTITWCHDPKSGRLAERANGEQVIRYTYSPEGLPTSVDYGSGEKITYTHDADGRPLSAIAPDSSFEFSYDRDGRPLATRALCPPDDYLVCYRHNSRGQRTGLMISERVSPDGKPEQFETIQQTEQAYDPDGRLSHIFTNGIPVIRYEYDPVGRPVRKTYGAPEGARPALSASIAYDAAGRLGHMTFQGGRLTSPLELIYEWDEADQLTRRTWNGRTLRYEYDPSGELLKAVDESDQSLCEAYSYDLAGNMLTKFLHGRLTAMTYNAGNQLVTSYDLGAADPTSAATLPKTPDSLAKLAESSLSYHYDRAGRMTGTGTNPTSTYGWLDKLTRNTLPDGSTATHTYWPDGQLAAITTTLESEDGEPRTHTDTFLWDGLALIKRNDTIHIIEPHPSGGVPIASHPVGRPNEITYHLNDLLGTTLATAGPAGVRFTSLTSFGQALKTHTSGGANTPSSPTAPTNPIPTTDQLPPTQ